jgi:hypothetical protein
VNLLVWLAYHWEPVSLAVGLATIGYGAVLEARDDGRERAERISWLSASRRQP